MDSPSGDKGSNAAGISHTAGIERVGITVEIPNPVLRAAVCLLFPRVSDDEKGSGDTREGSRLPLRDEAVGTRGCAVGGAGSGGVAVLEGTLKLPPNAPRARAKKRFKADGLRAEAAVEVVEEKDGLEGRSAGAEAGTKVPGA